jgi:hypothetical protein
MKESAITNMTRRQFAQSHGIIAMLLAYLCGVKLDAKETDNTGFRLDRTRWNDDTGLLEKALAEQWAIENSTKHGGHGIAQQLMLQAARLEGANFDPWLSARERKIIAMMMQWLGTNCGHGFLFAASKRAGKKFVCYPFRNPNE